MFDRIATTAVGRQRRFVLGRLREPFVADVRDRQELADVHAGKLLERLGVRDDVHPTADEEEAHAGPGRGIVYGLIDPDLGGPGAALEEEVV
jgi:hypothetical protein